MGPGAAQELIGRGWTRLPYERDVDRWARSARRVALQRLRDPEERAQWLQCEGTWFVGVGTLPNDAAGAVGESGPLPGAAIALVRQLYGDLPLHRGQVSVTWPGYPRPREGEGEAAFRYRLRRDAAHLDGLLRVDEARHRRLRERHAWILGLPLSACDPGASPLVVWEGSHVVMRRALQAVLGPLDQADWADVDLTEVYQAARREVFETCPRVELPARPGEATLVHRLAVHGVAPWAEGAVAPEEDGRMIAYFRPAFAPGTRDWLEAP